MTTKDFVSLLQNELIIARDPHIGDRLSALLEEHFLPHELATASDEEQEPSAEAPTPPSSEEPSTSESEAN